MNNHYHKYNNHLIHETSPYLLQHANNPVDWHAWNKETLLKAKKENKPILVSIGYSACHWCHVMEHESFEDEHVAKIMNEHFICIKVDREERPDVDQVYMDAVQMLSGRGGWPLNCFALPDGKPFWGATYFPKEQWMDVLNQISHLYKTQRADIENQANEIAAGIERNNLLNITSSKENSFSRSNADEMVTRLTQRFDQENGGSLGAPKFPMPNIYQFLLRYWYHTKNQDILNQVNKTLTMIAKGGIYDQIGGGFSRYSVDDHWHIPHFEKMLYDNAQLISLYAEAFMATKSAFYREIIENSLEFVKRELTSVEGGFYAALDADSDGEEGKYYIWTKSEIEKLLGKDAELIKDFFGIDKEAYWEDEKNVLVRKSTTAQLAEKYELKRKEIGNRINVAKTKMLTYRSKRVSPGLDDKILTSWNALMLKGYVDAYRALGKKEYLDIALSNGRFISQKLYAENGTLFRNYKNGRSTIPGFLDDYSFTIEAFIGLYEITFDEIWINKAKSLASFAIAHFYDKNSGMFYYSSDQHTDVVSRKTELMDNVIPASNSSMAKGLISLGLLFDENNYLKIAEQMVAGISENLLKYPSAFTNWGMVGLSQALPFYTLAICGENAENFRDVLKDKYLPNLIIAGSTTGSTLPVLKDRYKEKETKLFVCTGTECLLPAVTLEEALNQIKV